MKKLVAIFTLLFSATTFVSPAYAEWSMITNLQGSSFGSDGNEYFVDVSRIREYDGDIYFWLLHNYLEPDKQGILSATTYVQANCTIERYKYLTYQFFYTSMATGTPEIIDNKSDEDWSYIIPKTNAEYISRNTCAKHWLSSID